METSSCFSDAPSTNECQHLPAPLNGVSSSTLDLTGIATWNWEESSGRLSVSKTWFALFGVPNRSTVSFQDFLDALHAADRSSVEEQLLNAFGQGRSCRLDHRVIWPDGSERWLTTTVGVFCNQVGAAVGLAGVSMDVTPQKRIEAELRAKEAELSKHRTQFQLILATVDACEFEFDPVTDTGVWSEELEKLYGLQPGEFSGKLHDWKARLLPEDLPRAEEDIVRILSEGQGVSRFRIKRQDTGETRWMECRAKVTYDAAGKPGKVLGVHIDVTARVKARQLLHEREEQLKMFIEHSPAAIAMLDREMRYLVVSDRWLLDYRVQDRSVIGRCHYEVFPDIPEHWRQVHERCLAGASEGCDAERFPRADGRVDWVRWKIHPWRDARGEVGGLIIFSEVVTERVETEMALRLSQERMRAFLNNKSIVAWMKDEAGKFVFLSDHFRYRFGVGKEWQGLTDFDLWPRHLAERYRQTDLAVLSTGNPLEVIEPNDQMDGTFSWWLKHKFLFVDAEGKRYVGGLAVDVTERQQFQAALLESEQRYRNLVEATFDWIWEVDAHGRFTYSSPQVQDLLGYAPAEVVGRPMTAFMAPDEAKKFEELFSSRAAQQEPFSGVESVNLHKQGRPVALESSGVPVLGPKGELRGYRGMDRDVTARKQLEAQLRQAQKLEAIGQLAGGVAHDFNNILASMMMQIALMEMESDMDTNLRSGLEDLEKEARRAANLTRQLLMFSRRSVLDKKQVDLNQVVADLLKMLGRLIGEDIHLQVETEPGLPSIEADVGMMEQVLMNLVVNGRDAMPRGGRITIRTSLVSVSADGLDGNLNRRPGTFVCLEVSDTGCGMDSETLKRLFEPFFTTKEPGKGTGLGLATVHGIIAQHKGWVEVQSTVGSGSTFSVYLPTVAVFTAVEADASDPESAHRGNETILLVEDEEGVRRVVSRLLRSLGYQILEAGNGQEAIKLWQLHRSTIDLLFTDMVMPEGMTGLEVVEQLQADKPELKAIISSGYSVEIARMGLANRTGVAYLAKPSDAKTMAEAVRKCLDSRLAVTP